MAETASNRQFFLGINGQQSGPFSEADLQKQWGDGIVSTDALVWCEGMTDWSPISIVFGSASAEVKPEVVPPGLASTKRGDSAFATFASKEQGLSPVFNDDDAGSTPSGFLRYRLHIFLFTFILIGFLGAGGFYVYTIVAGPKAEPAVPVQGKRVDSRDLEYRQAVADILTNSDQSLAVFEKLVRQNASDTVGKQALEAAIDYYRRSQRPHDIGRFLIAAKRPADAAPYFRGDQPLPNEELNALVVAFEQEPKPEFLMRQIELQLGPFNGKTQAIELIKKFEQRFPRVTHPFGFYLKTPEQQIADLFGRISFTFVQSLLAFVETELPQVHFPKRPLVEIKRFRSGGYRVEGSYWGDVTLSRDLLKGIHMVFWLEDDHWVLVDTNLTKERTKYSQQQREILSKDMISSNQMLEFLAQKFRVQFPKASLHQIVKAKDVPKPVEE